MSTYLQIHYHIVFGTKYRVPCLVKEKRHFLFQYIHGVLKKIGAISTESMALKIISICLPTCIRPWPCHH